MPLSLRLVILRNQYAFAVCVGDEAVLAFSTYKAAALELQALVAEAGVAS